MRKRNLLTIFLTILFAAVFFCGLSFAAPNDEIAKSRQTISDSKEKLKKKQEEKSRAGRQLEELEKLKNDASAYIQEIDGQLEAKAADIASLENDIAGLTEAIDVVRREYEASLANQEAQKQSMSLRIRYMYENSFADGLAALFSGSSVADFLNRFEYVRRITDYDRDKLEEFKIQAAETLKKKEELDDAVLVLKEQQTALEGEKKELEEMSAAKQKDLSEYEKKISSEEGELEKLNSDIAGIQKAIKAEEASIAAIEAELRRKEEEARKKAEAEGKTVTEKTVGDISFRWPCPASSRITSKFGSREAPVEGASTSHKGIDIGASSGSDVLAAADGEVVIATYSASAGNYVMISHGGDVCTVYMHMSEIRTKVGSTVSKGDVIGLVGSTGYSTGPHLHFGIRINGSYADPLGYVSP